jgi:cobalt/nickel transport system permease protein
MHLADIDYQALSKRSWLHDRRTDVKGISTLLVLIAVLAAQNLTILVVILCFLFLALLSSRLSMKAILQLSFYPLFFSSIFISILWSSNPTLGLLSLLKALSSAWLMITLVATTAYVDLFATLSKVLPALLVDLFLFTYRSFFILLEKVSDLMKVIRLRGGYHPYHPIRNIKNFSSALALLFVRAFEMNDRMYQIYSLRGYTGKLPLREEAKPWTLSDFSLILISLILMIGAML